MRTNYKKIIEKLGDLSILSEYEQKQTLVEALGTTHSYISIDKLNSLLPQEQYSKILFSLEKFGVNSNEQIQDEECFVSIDNNKIQLKLVGFGEKRDFVLCDIKLDEINLNNLLSIAKESAQTHFESIINKNSDSKESEETKNVLRYIQRAIMRFEKNKETGISYLGLNEKLDNFSELSDNEKIIIVMNAMAMTQSHIELDELKKILPQEHYDKIIVDLRNRIANEYTKKFEKLNASEEKKNAVIESCLANDETTFISVDKNGIHLRREMCYGNDEEPKLADIDPKDLDIETLLPVVEKAMETHEAYGKTGTIWENSLLTSEQIKNILAKTQHAIVKDEVKEQQSYIQKQIGRIEEIISKVKGYFKTIGKGKNKEH